MSDPTSDRGVGGDWLKENEMRDGCYEQNRNVIDFCHRVCEFTQKAPVSRSQTNCCCQMAKISANIIMHKTVLGDISYSKSVL